MNNQPLKFPLLKLLVVIVDRNKVQKVSEVLQQWMRSMHFVCLAEGTASSQVLDMLGLGPVDKAVVLSVEPEPKLPGLLKELNKKLGLNEPGNGIAVTLPLSGVSSPMMKLLDKQIKETIKEETEMEVQRVCSESHYGLIVAVINHGFSSDLMDAARSAGATGGTVIHGKKVGEGAAKFFGISVAPEKEIVAIVVKKQDKHNIMKAINLACGIQTEAAGLIFSIPVEDVKGLDAILDIEE